MTKKMEFWLLALAAVAMALMPDVALAADPTVGESVGEDLVALLKGNIGTIVGLGIALLGLYTWLVQQSGWGVIMIIGGVVVTAFPGLFSSLQDGFTAAFTDASSDQQTILGGGDPGGAVNSGAGNSGR